MAIPSPKAAKRDTPRDMSWLYEDVAHQIILPHQLAATVLFRYLAKCANNSGSHYVGRAVICADCGLSPDTFNRAKNYLRSLGVLTWIKGHGNQHSEHNTANTYQLHIKAMQLLVKVQGVFIPATRTHTGPRLLRGDSLTEQVKLITAINEQFAATDLASAATDADSATTDFASATTDNRPLTLCNTPSTKLPSERNPLQNPEHLDSSSDFRTEGLPSTREHAPTSVAPLRPIISRSAHCASKAVPPAPRPAPPVWRDPNDDRPIPVEREGVDWRKQSIPKFSQI